MLIALIGLGGASRGEVTGLGYLAFGGFTVFRGLRSSSVSVDSDAVLTRSILRTRRFPVSKLAGVEVAVGRTGMNGFGREHLVLSRIDGPPFAFKELNAKPSATELTEVRRAAAAIDAAIRDART